MLALIALNAAWQRRGNTVVCGLLAEREMVFILVAFAILEFIGGISVLAGSKSAIHEILGTLAIGFSIMTLGLAGHTRSASQAGEVA
jgi:hypothetical protein